MRKFNQSIAAFSLVEVTIALGVVVFCLVTVLGLLAVGINSSHGSTIQTSATNILTAISSDLQSAPNVTPYSGIARGSTNQPSTVYGIIIPAGSKTTATSNAYNFYLSEDGLITNAPNALYQLNVWTTSSSANQQETLVRLLLSWPAAAQYTNSQGYVENVVAINRT